MMAWAAGAAFHGKSHMATAEAPTKPDFKSRLRLASTDLEGNRNVVLALADIRGIGVRTAEILVDRARVPRWEKLGNLSDEKVEELGNLVGRLAELTPPWNLNRQRDFFSGQSLHIIGPDLEVSVKDDVNRMKMIRSYKGIRHEQGQKVRGQRTRSNGRSGLTVGVMKKAAKAAAAAAAAEGKEGK